MTVPSAMLATTHQRVTAVRPLRAGVIAGAAVCVDVAMNPAHTHVPLCPLHALTGVWCPLCGGLRAVSSLARGDIVAAMHANVLVAASVPVVCAMWLVAMLRPDRRWRLTHPMWAAVVAIAIVFTIVRNTTVGELLHP